MKKFLTLSLAAAACVALSACSSSTTETTAADTAAETEAEETEAEAETEAAEDGEKIVVKVAASPTPHAEILNSVKDILAEEGIDLQVTEYGDYVIPNTAVEEGEMDANYFQHVPYLDQFNEENGTHLVSVAGVHIEPMAVYAGKAASFDELADGATIAVPNDVTNEARALLLLQSNGLIKLKDEANLSATPNDIVENTKNIQFKEVEAAMIPNIKDEVDLSVINSNYAMQAGLNPVGDSLAIEDSDSPYVNVLVVKEGNEDAPGIPELVEALHSETCKKFIEDTFDGAVVPAF
ncbi:MAG: MetQ/NlpA family ABC transporter substrate-binding protein [Lachnospiraceae bacterium]|nr:MetQ/NlpA family ABC transporter substrate-binding protein [Lachnospiraceae bacterium]